MRPPMERSVSILIFLLLQLLFGSYQEPTYEKEVVLTEGTNMALAVSPNQQEIVIDLQGTLWLLSIEGGVSVPITDPVLDATDCGDFCTQTFSDPYGYRSDTTCSTDDQCCASLTQSAKIPERLSSQLWLKLLKCEKAHYPVLRLTDFVRW